MSRMLALRASVRRSPIFRPQTRTFISTAKRSAPRVQGARWSLKEIEPTLFQPDANFRLAWSVAQLLEKHLPFDEPFAPKNTLDLTADCASLFYPNHVPKTLSTQERLNLIQSKKLYPLPRMVEYVASGYSSAAEPNESSNYTFDDIAKNICGEFSIAFAAVKKALPDVYATLAEDLDGEEQAMLSLRIDEEEENKVVAGAVAIAAYTQWMNQVVWELEVGDQTYGTSDFDEDAVDEYPQPVHPLLHQLTQ